MIYAHRLPGEAALPGFHRRLVAGSAGEQIRMGIAGKVFCVAKRAIAHGSVTLQAAVWEMGRGVSGRGRRDKCALLNPGACRQRISGAAKKITDADHKNR
jgi:hypothetical protein